MSAHDEGQFCTSKAFGRGPMFAAALSDAETASAMIRHAENLEAKRQRRPIPKIRPELAARIGATPDTLRNVRKLRRKTIPSWMMNAIRMVLIEILQAEIREHAQQVFILQQIGADPGSTAFLDVRTRAAELCKLIEQAAAG